MVQGNDPQETNKNQQELTPAQQRKLDALELAELIYNIYNSNCPVSPSSLEKEGKSND
ncbi:hypothetical protein KDA11_06385 [Candidatus Saccharibacteria bacterium]|nr:hypothetical protein [Candidatus Saccharibacteria bacterium]